MKKFFSVICLFFLLALISFSQELTQNERVLKQTVLYKAGKTYIENARNDNGEIARWNKAKMPIIVYCEMASDVPSYYLPSFVQAVKIWEIESNGLLKFKIVANEDGANIKFKILREKPENLELAYTETRVETKKKILLESVIFIYQRGEDGKFYTPNEVLSISVHEMGHALGIFGHSNIPTSIMYAEYSTKNRKISDFLNLEDKNTLQLLYKIAPDYINGDRDLEVGNIDKKLIF